MAAVPQVQYCAGLDLGQVHEFSALAVLERAGEDGTAVYAVRHLERFPPGTSYPAIGAALAGLFAEPPLAGTTLVMDQTAVGRPVVKLLQRADIKASIRPVVITGGHAAGPDGHGGWLAPKVELVSTLQVLLQSRRLRIAPSLLDAETLVRELQAFKAKVTLTESLDAWRDGAHDDLVLAIAVAAWDQERKRRLWVA